MYESNNDRSNNTIISYSPSGSRSPTGVQEIDFFLERSPKVATKKVDHKKIDIGCGCFNFLDFFHRGSDERDDFVNVPIDPIENNSLVFEDEKEYNMKKYQICVNGGGDGEKEIRDDHVSNHEENANEYSTDQELHKRNDCIINLSFTNSSFSEGDDSGHANQLDDNDEKSDSSSTLSFDQNDFEEQEFENDYGINNNTGTILNISFNAHAHARIGETKLETIIENEDEAETSYSCDVGTNFREIFICTRGF